MNIETLLHEANKQEASDIHITTGIAPVIRVHGQLMALEGERLTPQMTEELIKQLLINPKHQETFKQNGEVDFSFAKPGIGRYRVNVFRQRGSYAAAIRHVPTEIPAMSDIGLPEQALCDLCNHRSGLILVTGPTGSGKSTTLATMIDYINRTRGSHILTLEDPIEYLHKHQKSLVNQREIGVDSASYGSALKAALREDPDVILVGEMRDLETISIAITAAETGHLVLSTLHTVGAIETIDRIVDVFPPYQQEQIKVQLAHVLKGVISQQLIPCIDNRSRAVALEIMLSTPATSHLIREGKTHQLYSVIQTGTRQGMITMESALSQLYRQDRITAEQVKNYSHRPEEIKRLIEY